MEQFDMDKSRILRRVGWALFLMVLSNLASQLILEDLSSRYLPGFYQSEYYMVGVVLLSVIGVGYPVFLAVIRKVPDSKCSQESPAKLTVRQFIGLFFVCVAFMYLSSIIGSFIIYLFSNLKGREVRNPVESFIKASNIYLNVLYTVVIGPIMEEFIFRKVLLNKVRRFGDRPAIIFTGIAFGLYHLNLSQFLYAATLGIIFSYTAIRTNTIKYTIIIHMILNAIGTVIAPYALKNTSIMLLLSLWLIVSIVVGLVIFVRNRRCILLEEGAEKTEKKSEYYLHTGTLLYILLCIFMMVYQIVY